MQYFQVFHWGEVQAIKIVKIVITNVKNFKAMQPKQPSWISIFVQLAEEGIEPVLLDFQNSELGKISKASECR